MLYYYFFIIIYDINEVILTLVPFLKVKLVTILSMNIEARFDSGLSTVQVTD